MKILFDCRYTRLGRHDGISRYGARLVEELARLHPDVTMLISDERQLEMLPELPWVIGPSPTGPGEPWVARHVNRHAPDVVFTPMQTMGPLGRRYALVTTVHDLIYYRHPAPPRDLPWGVRVLWRLYHTTFAFQRWVLSLADAHVTDSQATKSLMDQHRLTKHPVEVILLGVDAPEQLPVRTEPAERTLVYMGSFMPYKNVELLAAAMHELPGYRLQLMSRISPARRAEYEALAPSGSIEFFDGVTDEEYQDALLNATALVSASRDEGFGLPVVEAQAIGTPVLLADTEIFREIGGQPAGFFDPDSTASFAAAVHELEDAGEWARRSAASVEWSRRYSWPAAAAHLLRVLTETHERYRARSR